MKKSSIISKTSYQKRNYESLAAFATNVANLMTANPAYSGKADAVAALKTLTTQYAEAIDRARDRAVPHVKIKQQLRDNVVIALDAIVDWMIAHNNGDPLWASNAGFEATPKEKKPADAILEPPFNLEVTSTKVEGQAQVKFRLHAPKLVKTNAVEYSADNGVTWHNGTYGSSRGILMSNLPKQQVVQVKVRSLGAGSNVSGWSEVVSVYVY